MKLYLLISNNYFVDLELESM